MTVVSSVDVLLDILAVLTVVIIPSVDLLSKHKIGLLFLLAWYRFHYLLYRR
jgi:hypothetical protein